MEEDNEDVAKHGDGVVTGEGQRSENKHGDMEDRGEHIGRASASL